MWCVRGGVDCGVCQDGLGIGSTTEAGQRWDKKKKKKEVHKCQRGVCLPAAAEWTFVILSNNIQNIRNFILFFFFFYIRVVDHCGQRVQSPPANRVQECNANHSP